MYNRVIEHDFVAFLRSDRSDKIIAEGYIHAHTYTFAGLLIIISPKFEISGILWFWSGRRRRRRHRTPRLVFHVAATPMHVEEPYRFWSKSEKPKWPPAAIL